MLLGRASIVKESNLAGGGSGSGRRPAKRVLLVRVAPVGEQELDHRQPGAHRAELDRNVERSLTEVVRRVDLDFGPLWAFQKKLKQLFKVGTRSCYLFLIWQRCKK